MFRIIGSQNSRCGCLLGSVFDHVTKLSDSIGGGVFNGIAVVVEGVA